MAVTEQTTWLSRIGSWFRRGNGESADSTRSRISDDTPANNDDGNLADVLGNGGNSLATLVWHIAGNLRSRFLGFRTSDGEKPWRGRDEEFVERPVGRAEVMAMAA